MSVTLALRPSYDEDHETFRVAVRRLLDAEVVPYLDVWRSAGQVPARLTGLMGEHGFLATTVPEEHGGGGVDDLRFTVVLVEECVAVGATGLALTLARHCGVCIPAVLRLPMEHASRSVLRALVDGRALASPVFLGADRSAQCVPGAAGAGVFVVSRTTNDGTRTTSVQTRESVAVASVAVLGGREGGSADVELLDPAPGDDAVTPDADDLLRRDCDLWSAVVSVAGARAALALGVDYVNERKVFGRLLSSFENTRFRLAEIAAEVAAVQSLVASSLDALAAGTMSTASAAAARFMASAAHDHAVDQALQLHGGYGYMREYPVSHVFADARFLRQAAAATGEPRRSVAAAIGL